MHFTTKWALPLLSLFFASSQAQTWTDCNPLNATCPPNTALGVSNYTIDFQKNIMTSRVWNNTAGSIKYGTDGAEYTVYSRGDTPTVKTNFYIFFGQVEVIMKAAPGRGIVSSIVLLSDDLDEVDWEMIGGNNSYVQTNYFGKGNQTSFDRAVWHPVSNVQNQWHNYTVDWSREKLDWYIDGQIVRTLKYGEANGGLNYPQTPCDVRLGIWAGGDPKNPKGTIEWAGGETDYNSGPYTMTVKSVRISDATNGTQYVYGDRSGSMGSIQVKTTADPIKLDGENSGSAAQSATQRWNNLSTGAKIGIACGIAAVIGASLLVFVICCIKQRKAGKHERMVEDAKYDKQTSELMAYRNEMSRMRNEKLASAQSYPMPHIGNAGATFSNMHVNQGVGQGRPPMPNAPYSHDGYANSMSSGGSGRGYQRY